MPHSNQPSQPASTSVPNQQQPQSGDAVLGGANPAPMGGVVLGGLEGVRRGIHSSQVDERLGAIAQLMNYGQPGLDLLVNALQDSSLAVQKAAYLQLRRCSNPAAHEALRRYDGYRLFECLLTLRGHAGGVTAVAVSADGTTAVSAGRDATLRVWDLSAQEAFFVLPEPNFVYAIAMSPDNRTFTARHRRQISTAWDLRTGQQIDPDELPTRAISSVTTSPNRHKTGKHLISGSRNTIKIWNLQNGQEVITLQGHTRLVTAVAVSTGVTSGIKGAIAPANPILVSGSEDKTLKIWGVKDDL
jgi:WD40 repeat protein